MPNNGIKKRARYQYPTLTIPDREPSLSATAGSIYQEFYRDYRTVPIAREYEAGQLPGNEQLVTSVNGISATLTQGSSLISSEEELARYREMLNATTITDMNARKSYSWGTEEKPKKKYKRKHQW